MNEIDKTNDPYEDLTNIMLQFTEIDGITDVLETYLKLHEGKIGAHWLWCAIERIVRGERESDVLHDYGYVYVYGDWTVVKEGGDWTVLKEKASE